MTRQNLSQQLTPWWLSGLTLSANLPNLHKHSATAPEVHTQSVCLRYGPSHKETCVDRGQRSTDMSLSNHQYTLSIQYRYRYRAFYHLFLLLQRNVTFYLLLCEVSWFVLFL